MGQMKDKWLEDKAADFQQYVNEPNSKKFFGGFKLCIDSPPVPWHQFNQLTAISSLKSVTLYSGGETTSVAEQILLDRPEINPGHASTSGLDIT